MIFPIFSCSALSLDWNEKGLSVLAATRSQGCFWFFLVFPAFLIVLWDLLFFPKPFPDAPEDFFIFLSGENHPPSEIWFVLFVDASRLTSEFVFRKWCVFLVQYWSSWSTFQFLMPSPNNAYTPPKHSISIPPASYQVLLSHVPVLKAPQKRLINWLEVFSANRNFINIFLQNPGNNNFFKFLLFGWCPRNSMEDDSE